MANPITASSAPTHPQTPPPSSRSSCARNLKGLGAALLARLIAHCRNRGISQLVAEVLQQNARMLRLAERFGFRRQDAQSGTVWLVLELRPAAG